MRLHVSKMVTSCKGYGPVKLVCRVVFFEASYYHAARMQLAMMCGYGDKFRGLSWGMEPNEASAQTRYK